MLENQTNTPDQKIEQPAPDFKNNKILNKLAHEPDSQMNLSTQKPLFTIVAAALIVIAGTGTGFGISKVFSTGKPTSNITKGIDEIAKEGVFAGDIIGNKDKGSFKDSTAEGVLVKGGVDGEGSHHLVRPGGKSQNVYLTSSVLDLDELVDHKVEVWGDTFSAQKAGWLMDVVGAEVKELNAPKPEDYKE